MQPAFLKRSFPLLLALALPAAHGGGVQSLDPIEITSAALVENKGLIGKANSATEGTVTGAQLNERPLLRPGEVMEAVPGLIVTQHSGDGKANQYFLRGFNLDHGTDFATSLDGMPINLRTHAHGQGYSDLQFLIPELVDTIQYRKGLYAADQGDFATAGSAAIEYVRKLDAPFVQVSLGSYGFRRTLLAGSSMFATGTLLYGLEYEQNNGPWVTPEGVRKVNGVLKYSEGTRENGFSIEAMAYHNHWHSTDQVPDRAVNDGAISRFGAIDPSDGGANHRTSLSAAWSHRDEQAWTRANAYVVDSSLDLYSDFTYCLNSDHLVGNCRLTDQFEQVDQRKIYGSNASRTNYLTVAGLPVDITAGAQGRYDDIGNVGLYLTTNRQRYATVNQDRVGEGSLGLFTEAGVQWLEKFRSVIGMRADAYRYDVHANLAENSGSTSAHIFSPKLALVFGPWAQTEFYVDAGEGFHSNDARGLTIKVDPDIRDYPQPFGGSFNQAESSVTPLVKAKGAELGIRTALVPHLQSTLSLWQLDLASELRIDGDTGTTSPSNPTRRTGLEWSNYYTPIHGLVLDADASISRARYQSYSTDPASPLFLAGDYVAEGIERVLSVGVNYDFLERWTTGLRFRYFGPRPLIEDDSVRSQSTTLVNVDAGYKLTKNSLVRIDIYNLFDRKASDIDYLYASRLPGEAGPVTDIHTHPVEPRTFRVTYRTAFS